MEDIIRMDLELLEKLARELSGLSDEIEDLERTLRNVSYYMPSSIDSLVYYQLLEQRRNMLEAVDRASGLAWRILRAREMFERCERLLKKHMEELETNAYAASVFDYGRRYDAGFTVYSKKRTIHQSRFQLW